MQGGFEESSSIHSFLINSYQNRKPISELFSSFNVPKDIDSAYKKANENVPLFSFYYLVVAGIFSVFFLLSNRIALIPIAITIGCYYLSKMNLKFNNFELTPSVVLYGCIAINVILAILFSSIAFCYFFLIVFACICGLVIFGHACLIEGNKGENTNEI